MRCLHHRLLVEKILDDFPMFFLKARFAILFNGMDLVALPDKGGNWNVFREAESKFSFFCDRQQSANHMISGRTRGMLVFK